MIFTSEPDPGATEQDPSRLHSLLPGSAGALQPEDSVELAGQRMRAHHAMKWPVTEGQKLVGMVAEEDPDRQAGGHGHDPRTLTVGEIMTREIAYCFEDEACATAQLLMERRGLSYLPVVDRQMRVVGILSRAEVASAVCVE
jgi:CBS domain-containing protein